MSIFAEKEDKDKYLCRIMKHADIISESTRRNIRQYKRIKNLEKHISPFEIWAADSWHIAAGKTLHLNGAQKQLLENFENARENGLPLSFAVPHASNLGISAFCEAYIYWLQNIVGAEGNAAVFYPKAGDKKNAKYRFYRNANAALQKFNINSKRVKHLSGNSVVYNTGGVINSYYTPAQSDCARNLSPAYVLCADVAAMTPKPRKSGYRSTRREPLYRAFIAAKPEAQNALMIIEGNTLAADENGFWLSLVKNPGQRNFSKHFLPWYANENNKRRLDCSLKEFYNSMNDYEYSVLWKRLNLTVEQICWYRHAVCITENRKLIPAIYPATEQEARTRTLTDAPPRPPGSYILTPSYDNVHNPKSRTRSGPPPNIYEKAVVHFEEPPDNGFITFLDGNIPPSEKIIGSAQLALNPEPV